MAKRQSNKKAGKEVGKKTRAKGAAKSAGKKSTAHKPTDDKDKTIVEIPSGSEPLLVQTERAQTGKPTEGSKEVDVRKSDTEIPTGKVENSQKDDQTGGVTEAIFEAAAEAEKHVGEAETLQAEGEQTGIVVEAEDSDVAEIPSQETEDTQTDKSVDDVSESIVEDSVTARNPAEKIDDTRTDDQADEVIEAAAENQTIVDRIKKFVSEIFLIGRKTGDSTEEGIESPESVTNHTGKAGDIRTDNQAVSAIEANVEGSDDEIQTAVYSDVKPYLAKKTVL